MDNRSQQGNDPASYCQPLVNPEPRVYSKTVKAMQVQCRTVGGVALSAKHLRRRLLLLWRKQSDVVRWR